MAGIASVVAELMAGLGEADLRNREGVTFAAHTESGHAGHIRLKGEHHQIVDGAEIVARLRGGNIAVRPLAIGLGNLWKRSVEPLIGSPSPNLRFAHGGEILLHAPLVFSTHLLLEPVHLGEVRIEDAALATQFLPLGC